MPDPVTTPDIEDVLAQVRRLVLQAAPREAARPGAPSGALDRTRLVLTPALRVGEPEEPRAEIDPGAPRLDVPEVAAPSGPGSGRSRRAEEAKGIEAALGAGVWEPDGSEALDWMLGGPDESPGAGAATTGPGGAGGPPMLPRRASPQVEPAPRAAPLAAAAPQEGPAALDEDRLRALVAEVVRSELQGELGERITRNLRKLVRSEVFRALGSRQEP